MKKSDFNYELSPEERGAAMALARYLGASSSGVVNKIRRQRAWVAWQQELKNANSVPKGVSDSGTSH